MDIFLVLSFRSEMKLYVVLFLFIYRNCKGLTGALILQKTKKHLEAAGLDAGPSDWRAKPFFFQQTLLHMCSECWSFL